MAVLVCLLALFLLMFVAYRGFSVIVFAPLCAMLAVFLTDPAWVPPFFSGLYMDKLVGFVRLYFPVFLLGAIFGKLIELSGFAKAIVKAVIGLLGARHAMLAIVLVCALLTYGGVSLFVVAFAVYPFAAELFKAADIPKRLIPGTIALGAFTFTMDALPGTPQIQNIIPTTFFGTTTWAAPIMGLVGAAFVLACGMSYLEWRRRSAGAEGYGEGHKNEPEAFAGAKLAHPAVALVPLAVVFGLNRLFTDLVKNGYGAAFDFAAIGIPKVDALDVTKLAAVWAVEGALLVGIAAVLLLAWRPVTQGLTVGLNAAVAGAMLASLNTASEYGFGGVIAALPGFKAVNGALAATFQDPLINEAVTTTTLAGITGSASGGMSIALAAMGPTYLAQATAANIPPEVLHRVASMASGGMDTLPHNGAVITLLAVTGLTHRESYVDIFAMTLIKTCAVFVAIAFFRITGWY